MTERLIIKSFTTPLPIMHRTLTAYLLSTASLLSTATARNVDWCASSAPSGDSCQAIEWDALNIAKQIGNQLYTDYTNNDCASHSGSIDDIYYTVYATTTGGDCRSTAELGTVQGALYDFIKTEYANGKLCGSQCIKLSHGGTWMAWLTISTSQSALNSFTCDASVSVPNCGSCGKNCLP